MASPEVERPLASPSGPSPAVTSPGSIAGRSNLSKKVTFGRDVDPNVTKDQQGTGGSKVSHLPFRQRSRSGSHKSRKGGHSSGDERDEK